MSSLPVGEKIEHNEICLFHHSPMKSLRIFISSPGDVAEERDKARQVIAALHRRYGDEIALLPIFWENLPIPATASFQQGIEFLLSTQHRIDIAVFILWSRLGNPLGPAITRQDGTPYLSGTEREFDLMLSAFKQSGGKSPIILAYTRADDESFSERLDAELRGDDDLEELLRQRKLVKKFIQERFQDPQGHNLRAYHTYPEPVSFAQRLDVHLRGAVDALLGIDLATTTWSEAPYRSLDVFDVQHAPIFCGRDEEACDLLQRLRDQRKAGCAFVCIVGASGSGKSSVARAGVAATLMQRSFDDDVKEWRTTVFLPSLTSGDLFLNLAHALADRLPEINNGVGGLERLVKRLQEQNHQAVADLLECAFNTAKMRLNGALRLLLVLDQMEELWTDRSVIPDEREKFLRTIETLARSGNMSVLATLRSDFYPQAQLSETFLRMKGERGHFDLRPPGKAALQQLIVQPARRAGLAFERDERTGRTLDQVIFEDAAHDPSALPLLQYALSELFEQHDRTKHQLTFAAYTAIGGVEGALGQRAAQALERLPSDAKAALDELLPLIVSVDVAGEQNAVRRRAPLAELTSTPARRMLTQCLTEARFITTDEQNGTPIASLAHEALLRRWDRIANWIHANRDILRMRAQLEQSQQRWEKSSRASSLLLPEGLPLDEGRRLLLDAPHLLTPAAEDYVRRSIAKYLANAIETGRDLLNISMDVEIKHPVVWRQVVAQSFQSEVPVIRRNAVVLLASRSSPEFREELVRLILLDTDESVRQAAAQSLVLRGECTAYDQIRDTPISGAGHAIAAEVRGALARLLAVSDMQPKRPSFADWFTEQTSHATRPVRLLSRWLRLKNALPTFLFVLIPAAAFSVAGAASIKWLPSAFNFSCVQATASAIMGLFHAAPSGIILGGGIAIGLMVYRMVFGREYDPVSILRPLPAIAFGAVSGLIAGILCVIMIASVYQPEALQQMGWTDQSVRPPFSDILSGVLFKNYCGLAFPLTSVGLGIALALMTNSLRASKEWALFVRQQSAISSVGQLARVVAGIIRVTLPFAVPIPLLVMLFACVALIAMDHGVKPSSRSSAPLADKILGGLDQPPPAAVLGDTKKKEDFQKAQIARRTVWKGSLEGRALGLIGDGLAKIVGGYFCIVGIGLGIVVLRHGVKIEPTKV